MSPLVASLSFPPFSFQLFEKDVFLLLKFSNAFYKQIVVNVINEFPSIIQLIINNKQVVQPLQASKDYVKSFNFLFFSKKECNKSPSIAAGNKKKTKLKRKFVDPI
jgi:hypothetical protein